MRPLDLDPSLAAFIERLEASHSGRVQPHGGGISVHGIGFRLRGVDATFSVLTLDGALPHGCYNVQIESYPPGSYVYAQEYGLDDLLQLIAQVVVGNWP